MTGINHAIDNPRNEVIVAQNVNCNHLETEKLLEICQLKDPFSFFFERNRGECLCLLNTRNAERGRRCTSCFRSRN